MASFCACASTSLLSITSSTLVQKRCPVTSASPVPGLPAMSKESGKVRCSMEKIAGGFNKGMIGSVVGGVSMWSLPAMGLVDERMSTEGTGLPFGLSNNVLGWILLGVFALIWALYFIYASNLDEDEDSGLSL